MRIWLTALFVLVTAFAAITAYEIVHPILYETLNRSSEAAFKQVGDQFEDQVQRLRERGEQRDRAAHQRVRPLPRVAVGHSQGRGGPTDARGPGELVLRAGEACRRGAQKAERRHGPIETGVHKGQLQATYAYPINVDCQRQGRAPASGPGLRQVLHGERHRKRAGGDEEYRAVGPARRRPGAAHRRGSRGTSRRF